MFITHIQVFFIFGIMNEAVVNDAVTNPSQMNAYVCIQLLGHTNTCIIPENPISVTQISVGIRISCKPV